MCFIVKHLPAFCSSENSVLQPTEAGAVYHKPFTKVYIFYTYLKFSNGFFLQVLFFGLKQNLGTEKIYFGLHRPESSTVQDSSKG
jgi:hypothetical protein